MYDSPYCSCFYILVSTSYVFLVIHNTSRCGRVSKFTLTLDPGHGTIIRVILKQLEIITRKYVHENYLFIIEHQMLQHVVRHSGGEPGQLLGQPRRWVYIERFLAPPKSKMATL